MDIKLPSLGENIKSGDVLSILVSVGDEVRKDQGLLELETDKATMEVPSPSAGRITKIHVAEGETVPIGATIVSLDAAASETPKTPAPTAPPAKSPPPAAKEPPPAPAAKSAPAPAPAPAAPKPIAPAPAPVAASASASATAVAELPEDGHAAAAAGPAVRRLARELGVDLRRVRASDPSGRISREDVQAYVRDANQRASHASPAAGPTPPGEAAVDGHGPVRREKMSRLRQTIARNMVLSYTTIPQLTNFDDADVTDLERMRNESKDDYAARGIKLTTLPFLIKSIASALKLHPIVNASIDEEHNQIVYKEYVNIGVAVDTDRGLIVPVLRDVDRMNIPQIALAVAEASEKARTGNFTLEDLQGGTFTISNLGAIGGTYSTPIINPPEVAILLAGRSRKMPVYHGDQLVGRLMLPLSLTYDHRIVDGAAAARFLNEIKGYLSAPGRLLLAP